MRTTAPALLPLFRSQLQGELLAQVLLNDAKLTISNLARALSAPVATVARETARLERAGLLRTSRVGRARVVEPNESNPATGPLRQLVMIAFGPTHVIRQEFGQLAAVDQLMIFGSWAARYAGVEGPMPGDIDVLVIGRVDRDDVYDAARRAEARLGREVNTVVVSPVRWAEGTEPFLIEIRNRPTVELVGREDNVT